MIAQNWDIAAGALAFGSLSLTGGDGDGSSLTIVAGIVVALLLLIRTFHAIVTTHRNPSKADERLIAEMRQLTQAITTLTAETKSTRGAVYAVERSLGQQVTNLHLEVSRLRSGGSEGR